MFDSGEACGVDCCGNFFYEEAVHRLAGVWVANILAEMEQRDLCISFVGQAAGLCCACLSSALLPSRGCMRLGHLLL